MKVTIGADPELFVHVNGTFRSAYGMIPGTKRAPHEVELGAVQVDGMALEFNVNPTDNIDEFKYNIHHVMSTMKSMIPEGMEFSDKATAVFDPDHFKEQPEEATALGCDPDYSGYTEQVNPPPDAVDGIRVAGGHVHIGWTKGADPMESQHFMCCAQLAKQLDFVLGVPSMFWDTDDNRRKVYGRPGAFRPKPYGMEYRTLSNAWIFNDKLIEYVFRATHDAFQDLAERENDYHAQYGTCAFNALRYMDRRYAHELMMTISGKMKGGPRSLIASSEYAIEYLSSYLDAYLEEQKRQDQEEMRQVAKMRASLKDGAQFYGFHQEPQWIQAVQRVVDARPIQGNPLPRPRRAR
jgi:hypothetical protein